MQANEVKGINDLEVWLTENLSEFQGQDYPNTWATHMKHAISFDFMCGASRIETEVKLNPHELGWRLALKCECKEAILPGMKVDPVTVTGYFKTDRHGRIDGWQWDKVTSEQ
jgi:hypothetical protein